MLNDQRAYFILLDYVHKLHSTQFNVLLTNKIYKLWKSSYMPTLRLLSHDNDNISVSLSYSLKDIFYASLGCDYLKACFIYVHILSALAISLPNEVFSVDLSIIEVFLDKCRKGVYKFVDNNSAKNCKMLIKRLVIKNNVITSRFHLKPNYNKLKQLNEEFKVISTLIKIKQRIKEYKYRSLEEKDINLLNKLESMYNKKLSLFNNSVAKWSFFTDPDILNLPNKLDEITKLYKQSF